MMGFLLEELKYKIRQSPTLNKIRLNLDLKVREAKKELITISKAIVVRYYKPGEPFRLSELRNKIDKYIEDLGYIESPAFIKLAFIVSKGPRNECWEMSTEAIISRYFDLCRPYIQSALSEYAIEQLIENEYIECIKYADLKAELTKFREGPAIISYLERSLGKVEGYEYICTSDKSKTTFKREYGVTPREYLEMKIKKHEENLLKSSKSYKFISKLNYDIIEENQENKK